MDNASISSHEDETELKVENLQAFKVADLKRELKARGLGVAGNKTELLQRLQTALANGNKDPLESAEDLNEDDVLADDSLLSEEVKSQDLTEDDILDTKDMENGSSGGGGGKVVEKSKLKPKNPVEKPKITIRRNINIDVPSPVVTEVKKPNAEEPKVSKTSGTEKKIITIQPAVDSEKLTLRAKRFGVISDETKLKARAERFGDTLKTSSVSSSNLTAKSIKSSPVAVNVDQLKQRAARFGQVISPAIKQVEEKDRLLKRKERFGTMVPSLKLTNEEVSDRKKKRLERFAAK